MDKAKLEALLERVEKATGPDREIDTDLWLSFTEGATRRVTTVKSATDQWPAYDIDETREASGKLIIVPEYTDSIDAALALVERVAGGESTPSMVYNIDLNWHASAHSEMAYVAELFVADGEPCVMTSYHAQSYTWPLAILAALLKALIAQEATCAS